MKPLRLKTGVEFDYPDANKWNAKQREQARIERRMLVRQAGRDNDLSVYGELGGFEQMVWHMGRIDADPSHKSPYGAV